MLKKVIIGILCFVILAVTGLGVYIYTLDWNKHKNLVAQRFSQITGLKASIDGNLNVKVFPKPSFSAGMVKFTKNGSRDPLFEINDIKADVELMPLLDNKFIITSMTLTGATTHLIISEKGEFNWKGVKGSNKNKSGNIEVSFNDVRLTNSYISYQNKQTKDEFEIPNISANISATSLKGPYRTSGKFIHNKSEISFSGDIINDNDVTLKMSINNASTGSKLSIDGTFGPKAKGNVTFDSKGLYDIVSVIFGENKFPNIYDEPLYFSFQYDHNKETTKFDNFTAKYGKQTAGSGVVNISKNDKWNIEADFDMLQFDLGLIENIAKNIVNASKSEENKFEGLKKYNANLNIKANHATYRGADVQKLILGLGLNDNAINVNRLGAVLPGDTSVKLTGKADLSSKLNYIFNSSVESKDLRVFASLFGVDLAKNAPKNNKNSIFKNANIDLELSGDLESIKLSVPQAVIDATNLSGNIGFVLNEEKNFVLVQVNASKLSFDKYLNLSLDKKSSLKDKIVHQINLAPWKGNFETEANVSISNAIYSDVAIEKLDVSFTSNDNKLLIKEFLAQGLVGADIRLIADIDNVYTDPQFNELSYTIKTNNFPMLTSSVGLNLGNKSLFKRKLFSTQGVLSGNISKFSLSSIQKFGDVEFSYTGDISLAKGEKEVYKGDIELKADNFTNFVHDIGFDYTPDIPATSFTISGAIKGNGSLFDVSNFNAYLGANNIAGDVILDITNPKTNLVANVKFDKLDINRMFNIKKKAIKLDNTTHTFIPESLISSDKFDLKFMKEMDFNIKSNISQLIWNNKNYSNSVINADLKDNILKVNKFITNRDENNINLTFEINNNSIPKISGKFDIVKFELPMLGGSIYAIDGGKLDADGSFNSLMTSKKDFIDNLNSKGRFKLFDTTLKGWDLDIIKFELEQRKSVKGFEDTVLKNLKSGKSQFSEIKGWYEINKGVAVINEATWVSPVVNMNMKLDLNLSSWKFNSEFNAFYNNASFSDILKFTFYGDLDNPTISTNLSESIERLSKLENVIAKENENKEKEKNEQTNEKRINLLNDIDDALLNIKRMSFDVTRFKPVTNNDDVLKVYNSNIKELEEAEKNLKNLQLALEKANTERELMDLEAQIAKESSRTTFVPKALEENYIVDSKYIFDDIFNKLTWLYNLAQNNTSYYNSLTDVYMSQIDFMNTTDTPVSNEMLIKAKTSMESVDKNMKKIDSLYNKMRENYLTIIDSASVADMKNNNKTTTQTLRGMLTYVKELSKQTIDSIDIFRGILGINARDYDLYMVYPPETIEDIDVNKPTVKNGEKASKTEDKVINSSVDEEKTSDVNEGVQDKKKDNLIVSFDKPNVGLSNLFNKLNKQKASNSLLSLEFAGLSNAIKNKQDDKSLVEIAQNSLPVKDNVKEEKQVIDTRENIPEADKDTNEATDINKETDLVIVEAKIDEKSNNENITDDVNKVDINESKPAINETVIIAENTDIVAPKITISEDTTQNKNKSFFTTDIVNKTKNVIANFMSKITKKKTEVAKLEDIVTDKKESKTNEIAQNDILEKKLEENINNLRDVVKENIAKDIVIADNNIITDELKEEINIKNEEIASSTTKHQPKVNPVVALNIGKNDVATNAEIEIASKLKKKTGFVVKNTNKLEETPKVENEVLEENNEPKEEVVVAEVLPVTPKLSKNEFLTMFSNINELSHPIKSSKSNSNLTDIQQNENNEEAKNKYVFADNGVKTDFSGQIGKSILSNKNKTTSLEPQNKYLFKPSFVNINKTSGIVGKKFALSVK